MIPCEPSLLLTSTLRMKRAYSSIQVAWSVLLTIDVGYESGVTSPPAAVSRASAVLFSEVDVDPLAMTIT